MREVRDKGFMQERDLIDLSSVPHGWQDWLVARKLPGGTFEVLGSGDWPHAVDGAWLLPD